MITTPRAARPDDRSGLIDLEFGRMYVRDRGPRDAPALVLLHGMLVTHHEFRLIQPALASRYRVIAPDLPGCGASDRPPSSRSDGYSLEWLARVVGDLLRSRELALAPGQPVHLLGHSLGGAIATLLATQPRKDDADGEPQLASLVLVDTSCFTMPMPLEGRLALVPGVGPLVFKRLYRQADLRRYFERVYRNPELARGDSTLVYWDHLTREGGREAAYAMLQQVANLDAMSARFCEVPYPTLVVWGEHDALIPLDYGRRVADLIPDARLEVIADSGHAPNEERPEALVDLLFDHIG